MAGLNDTPRGQRLHIALFGRRNAGKSSLINALTGQEVAIVAEVPGTTTDPVAKAMEIYPLGPVMLIDTAGIDDTGHLGCLRVKKSLGVLQKTDLILLVVDPAPGVGEWEREVVARGRSQNIPVVAVVNKIDKYPETAAADWSAALPVPWVPVSALTGQGIDELKRMMVRHAPRDWTRLTILGDLIAPGDTVVLVIPIDKSAPKGRLILPQQQVIRDILDHEGVAVMAKERELDQVLRSMTASPALVVTDASVYRRSASATPQTVPFTSFSILFARFKGDLPTLVAGIGAVNKLHPGDRVLVAEACTHHPLEDDIGRVQIPRWLTQTVGGDLEWHVVAGGGALPENFRDYQLIIHCGACMLNRREMLSRVMQARAAGVPIVNYGILLAHIQGILRRVLSPFPEVLPLLERVGPAGAEDADVLFWADHHGVTGGA